MIKTCMICGIEFDGHPNRKYCSDGCALRARVKSNVKCNRRSRDKRRRKWANSEAHQIYAIAKEDGVEELASYIFSHYQRKSQYEE